MSFDVQPFRAHYRARIHRWYNPWLHGGFVLTYGLLSLWLWGRLLGPIQAWEWLTIPFALVLFNWGEYTVHRHWGHTKQRFVSQFYARHTGDHHSFFVAGQMPYESSQDWRVILFPAWLIVLFSLGLWAAWWALFWLAPTVASLFAMTMLLGYLSYEIFHACEHLPATHPLARLPWVRHMRRLHEIHHRRDSMQQHNFNIVWPLTDWLKGTLNWEPDTETTAATGPTNHTKP